MLARAEGNDAPHRIVRGNPYGHPIAGHDLDSESAHPTAELREHLVAGVRLDAVQPAAVHGNHRPLNVYQIVLTQTFYFLSCN
jgi:hypothetical protein